MAFMGMQFELSMRAHKRPEKRGVRVEKREWRKYWRGESGKWNREEQRMERRRE
jgi:hypothetical protein